ncbi:MAG: hypothetical protein NC338_07995, partial [Firmicutes bacterium]|nr:hypothetical protein [Bacillota bacterium]
CSMIVRPGFNIPYRMDSKIIKLPNPLARHFQPAQKFGMHSIIYLAIEHLSPFFFKRIHNASVMCS